MLSDIILHNMGMLFEPHIHMCMYTLSLSFSLTHTHTQYVTTWASSEFQVWTESSCMPHVCQLWHVWPWGWWFNRRPSTWFCLLNIRMLCACAPWVQEAVKHMKSYINGTGSVKTQDMW